MFESHPVLLCIYLASFALCYLFSLKYAKSINEDNRIGVVALLICTIASLFPIVNTLLMLYFCLASMMVKDR